MACGHLCLVHSISGPACSDSCISSVKWNSLANGDQHMVQNKKWLQISSCVGKQPRCGGCGSSLSQSHVNRRLHVTISIISASSFSLFVPMCRTGQLLSPDRQQTSGTMRDLNNFNINCSVRTFVLVWPSPGFRGLTGKMTELLGG